MEISLRARNCRQRGAREKDMCEREKYMSYSTVMSKRRYRARERRVRTGARERTYTSLARTNGTCLSLSHHVGDSFEAITLRQ